MKKENSGKKKSLLWLWITLAVVVAVAIAGVLCYVLGVFEGSEKEAKFESKLYWNLDREGMMDPTTGLSMRESAEDGLYYVRFAVGGQVEELPVADGMLVSRIDTKDIMCLKFNSDGIIIDVVDADEVYTKIADRVCVQQVNGNNVLTNSSQALNGMSQTVVLNENTGIYNVTNMTEKPGYPGAMEPMDQILVYGTDENTPTDVFIVGRNPYSDVYWRVSPRMYDATNKRSSRERQDDGYWYMDWTVNGEIVTLRTSKLDVINAWDGYSPNDACCGMVFDEYGDVVDCFNAGWAARGIKTANGYDITALAEDGSSFTATRIMFGTEVGKTYTSTIDENTKIFNVNSTADVIGEPTELQMNDRLLVITDSMGKAKIIYVINRMVDSPMYYNVSRNYSTGLQQTQRTPDADGWYHIKLAVQGREVTYRTRNRDLVNQIDAYSMSLFGLKVENGIILKAYDAVCVTGNYSFAANNFVDSIDGVLLATSNTAGTAANGVLAENCEIYDVSGHGTFKGVKTTVRVGDRVICYQNAVGEITHVYIINRHEKGSVLYWNVNRYYGGGQSTRADQKFEGKPLLDEEGYYHFRVIKVGTTDVTWVKTKDKAIVDRMDSYGTPTAFSLYVNSAGVVTGAYPCNASIGGYQAANYLHIDRVINEDEAQYGIKSYRTGATGTITLAEDVAIYDYTADSVLKGSPVPAGGTIKGSRTSLRVGDKVSCVANREGKIQTIFIIERETSGTQLAIRKSGSATPAEDGYYYFELVINGQVKKVKTKDEATAKKIVGFGYAFAVKLSGDEIVGVYTATASTDVYEMAGGAYYDVVSISGGKVNLKRNRVGQSDTGKETSVDLASGYKAYVIDPNSPNFGKLVSLHKGDRIYAYTDYNAQMKYIFVAYECTREGGNMGYCAHCGKNVHWESIAAGYTPVAGYIPEVAHFYVPYDCERASGYTLGAAVQTTENKATEIVLDLNGKVLTRKGTVSETDGIAYASGGLITAQYGNTLIITDYSKAQTGALVAQKGVVYSSYTGLAHIQAGSTMIIEKGLFDASGAVCNNQTANGGAISVGGTLIVNGGTIKGFKENTNAAWGGTAIGSWGNTQITINGGTIIGGKATNMGGTISANSNLTINGGKIYGGTAGVGDNIRFGNGDLVITGGEIDGGIHVSSAKSIVLSGKPVIKAGANYGLKPGAVKIDVSGLKAGAQVYVDASGVFTKELASEAAAQALVDNGALKAGAEGMVAKAQGKAVAAVADGVIREWTDTTKLPDMGRWKLAVDVNTTAVSSVSGELYIDLNGHDITRAVAESALTAPQVFNVGGGNKLTIDDTSAAGDGTVSITLPSADSAINAYSAVIHVPEGGEMVLEGGIIDGSNIDNIYVNANNGTISVGGKLTVNGGTIKGFKRGSSNGGAIGGWANTEIVVNGGQIYAGGSFLNGTTQKVNGAAIATTGSLVVNGGEFIGPGTPSTAEQRSRSGGLIYANGDSLVINGGIFRDGFGTGYGFNIYYERNYRGVADPETGVRPTITGGGEVIIGGDAFIKGGVTIRSGKASDPVKLYVQDQAVIDDTGAVGNQNVRLVNGELYLNDDTTPITTTKTAGIADNANYNISIVYTCQNEVKGFIDGNDIKFEHNFGDDTICDDCGHVDMTVELSKTNVALEIGEDETITVTTVPSTATVTWTSSNEAVATVVDGKITAVGAGSATITATATYGETTKSATCAVTVTAPVVNPDEWTEWTDGTKLPTAGKYKLMTNVTISASTNMTGDLMLDLNGQTVTMTGASYAIATNGHKLTIDDLSGKTGDELGCIKTTATAINARAAVIYVNAVAADAEKGTAASAGEFILNNGVLDGSSAVNSQTGLVSGTVTVGNATNIFSTFTMNGGIIKGQKCSVQTSGVGGSCVGLMNSTHFVMNGGELIARTSTADNDYVSATGSCINAGGASGTNPTSTITINGGILRGSRTMNHGGVIYTAGNMTINGGTLYGAKTQNSSVIISSGATLNINGGLIVGSTTVANPGNGAIDKQGGTITVGGNAVIAGGINIRSSAKLVFTGTPIVDCALGAEQKFDVRINGGSVHLDSATNAAISNTNGLYKVTYDANGKVNGLTAFAKVTYTESATLPTSGAVKLTDDVTLTEALVTTGNLYIDLNGHTVTNTGNTYAIKAAHNVVITDTSAEKNGTIKTTTASITSDAAVIYITAGKKLVLVEGTLDGSAVTNGFATSYAGTVTVGNYASFVMLGGEVKGQISSSTGSTGKGGSCVGGWNNSNVVIYGGRLTAPSKGTTFPTHAVAAQGTCVSSGGNVEIHGGELYGTMATNHGANIYCTGNLTITGGLISGGYSNNSGLINCSGSSLTITGGTLVGGTAHSSSGLGGASIDYAKSGGILTIGGNAKIAGGVSIRGGAKLVLKDKAVIDMNMAGQTQKKFNIQIKSGECSIYLNDATGTAIASGTSGMWDVVYNNEGTITGVTKK